MTSAQFRSSLFSLTLIVGGYAIAQQPPSVAPTPGPQSPQTTVPQPQTAPAQSAPQQMPPDTKAPAPRSAPPQTSVVTPPPKVDRAQAYYHYALAHMYEELVAIYQRTEFADKAMDELKQALTYDPNSAYLNAGLAELYLHTNRIRDAVEQAQQVIKKDPNNVEARKLLGNIYLASIGDMQTGTQGQEMVRRAIEQFQVIAKLEPDNFDDHLLLGRLYVLDHDMAEGEAQLKQALTLRPDNEDALTYLAVLYNEEGDQKKASDLLESVPQQQRTAKLDSALGYTYEQMHDYKRAISAYQRAVDEDPDKENLDALRGLAKNLLNDGQLQAAADAYHRVAEADPQDADAMMNAAEAERRSGDYSAALADIKKGEAVMPNNPQIAFNEAAILEAQGHLNEAVNVLTPLIANSESANTPGEKNNRAIFLEHLGNIYKEQNKTQQAVDTYKKMISLGGDLEERGWGDIIDAYHDAKMFAQALGASEEAVKAMPKNNDLLSTLALNYVDAGKPEAGIKTADSMISAGSQREGHLTLAQIYLKQRDFKKAQESADKAGQLTTKPEDHVFVDFIDGEIFERQKKYDEAEGYLRKVLAHDPNNAAALNYLGYMLAEKGAHIDEAVADIKKAVNQEPQNYAYLDSLGYAYYKSGSYDLAEQFLLKALQRDSGDGTVHLHLGDVYAKTGRLQLATSQWERAVQDFKSAAPGDADPLDVTEAQKNLESARTKLAEKQNK